MLGYLLIIYSRLGIWCTCELYFHTFYAHTTYLNTKNNVCLTPYSELTELATTPANLTELATERNDQHQQKFGQVTIIVRVSPNMCS